jgi:alpha-L-rhamnosidase
VTPAHVTSVRAERRDDGTVVATPTPRLSWKTASTTPEWRQASAEIALGDAVATVSGRDSVFVPWPFAPLAPRQRVEVRVRVTGEDGSVSDWSDPQPIVAGFLGDDEWCAAMIGAAEPQSRAMPTLLRTEFEVKPGLRGATLYATAHGVYQAEVNGTPVDDEILKPGWTSYQWRLVHESTDVTTLVTAGGNALGLSLAGGWFTELYGFDGNANPFYGEQPAVAAQLVLEYADGTVETVATDDSWRATTEGPITASGIYVGEHHDATRGVPGWSTVGFDDSSWAAVRVDDASPTPEASIAPAVRAIELLPVREVITSPSGATILDFGQNLAGRLRITVRGPRGHVVSLGHAEVLEHGELGTRPLRRATSRDSYTLAGTGEEVWEPQFTFHGFRYAQVENWPGEFDPADVVAVVIHSDLTRTGWFDSSHDLVNRLHENVVWGMRGNFLSLPTDCPQRDERLGWTGDIEVFTPTASFLYDVDGFLAGWLRDLSLEQAASDGKVPFVVPNVLGSFGGAAAAWGDAATIVPSVLFERFGDLEVLRAQYPSMVSWTDHILAIGGDRHLWEDRFQFGDWLDPDAPADAPWDAKTDTDIVASAHLFRSTELTSRAAELLGETEAASRYRAIAERVRAAFLREFVTESGRMLSDAQTAYGLGIMFGLARDAAQETAMGERLAYLVRAAGYRIATGFVGTPLITDALTRTGHLDAAARLLTQTETPSWLYPVTMGATTVWERWDSMLEDGTINPGEMTSFNHYALGAVADWLHRSVAGLAPAEPGYRTVRLAPRPLPGFTHASARHETPYGLASVAWHRNGDTVTVDATVPANTTAEVSLPGTDDTLTVGSGEHSWAVTLPDVVATPGDVGPTTSLAAIIDDPEAYRVISDVIAEHSEDAARRFRQKTRWTPGRVLAESTFQLPQATVGKIFAAVEALSERRRQG